MSEVSDHEAAPASATPPPTVYLISEWRLVRDVIRTPGIRLGRDLEDDLDDVLYAWHKSAPDVAVVSQGLVFEVGDTSEPVQPSSGDRIEVHSVYFVSIGGGSHIGEWSIVLWATPLP